MTDHAHAIHALTQRIDLLFYLRRTHDDPAEARRQIRWLIGSVRVLREMEGGHDCEFGTFDGRHHMPADCHAARRAEAFKAAAHAERVRAYEAEKAAQYAAMTDGEVAEIARRSPWSFHSTAAIVMYNEIRAEAERRGLI